MSDILLAEIEKLNSEVKEWTRAYSLIAQENEIAQDLAAWFAAERDHMRSLRTGDLAYCDEVTVEAEKLRATVDRVRKLAERWEADPCVCGYRIPDGNGTDSQCLHCGATSLLRALDGEADRDDD